MSDLEGAKKRKISRDEKLVLGYLRRIESKRLSNQIIPSSIHKVFVQYFHIPFDETNDYKNALRRIKKELRDLEDDPPYNCSGGAADTTNLFKWVGTIYIDNEDSPYHDGVFFLDIIYPFDYPWVPPKIKFTTKIYHCNIPDNGEVFIDILTRYGWKPALSISKILPRIRLLIENPNPDGPLFLHPQIAKLYKTNRKQYDTTARKWTIKYAQ